MRCTLVCLWVVAIIMIGGCGVLDMVAGVHENPDGSISTGPGIGDAVGGLLGQLLGPWGLTAATALGWGTREYRHYRIIKSGGKDDNRDGIPDPPAPPKA